MHSFSQLNHANFFSVFACPHQNYLIILWKSSQSLFGKRKQLIVYEGTACATALIRISLPALVNSFSFQPDTLFTTLCFRWAKVLDFDHPTKEGKPRYDSWGSITWAPNKVFTSSLRFNYWPEEVSYTCNSLWISVASSFVARPKARLSSAKKMCETLGPLIEEATPLNFFLWTAWCNSAKSPSAQIRKRYGDNGSPYLNPRDGCILLYGCPLILTV